MKAMYLLLVLLVLSTVACSAPAEPSADKPILAGDDIQADDAVLTEEPVATEEVETMTNPIVLLKTNHGAIRVELFMETMPITAGNFKKLVEEGFYDGVIFHRIIPNFMIQGGDPTGTGRGDPGYKIKDEFTDNNRNLPGTLSMANAGPNTGGSQFFINTVDNSFLDTKHPVFGKVIEGMDVVEAISNVPTGAGDRPVNDVIIEKATIE